MSLPADNIPFSRPSPEELGEIKRALQEVRDNEFDVVADDDGNVTFGIPAVILDTPTPYERRGDGTVSKMRKTRGFRALYRVSEQLGALGAKPNIGPFDIGKIVLARGLLGFALEDAQTNPNATPELYMRIQLADAMADITAYRGSIIERHDEPRMVEAYEKLFFPNIYSKLLEVGYEVTKKYHDAPTGKERASYSGFAHELVFHLLHYRDQSALRFTTAASVYDDYFREGQRFDASVYNLKIGKEKSVDVQIKTRADQLADDKTGPVRVIYGERDLFNTPGNAFWNDTLLAGDSLPTLAALMDEAGGDTTASEKLDTISQRLHSRLFS